MFEIFCEIPNHGKAQKGFIDDCRSSSLCSRYGTQNVNSIFKNSKVQKFIIFKYFHENFFSDSDDSDTEGGLGNVERVVMRPPGHSGKAKRGHLCFDSSFETGKKSYIEPNLKNPKK